VHQYAFDTELNSACFLLCDKEVPCFEQSQAFFTMDEEVIESKQNCSQVRKPNKHGETLDLYLYAKEEFKLIDDPALRDLPFGTQMIFQYQCESIVKEFYLQTKDSVIEIDFKISNTLENSLETVVVFELAQKDNSFDYFSGCKRLQSVIQPANVENSSFMTLIADGDIFILQAVPPEEVKEEGEDQPVSSLLANG